PCPGGDPGLRAGDQRRRAALGAARLGGVRRLSPRGDDALARGGRGGPGDARRRASRPRSPRALKAGAGRAARQARLARRSVTGGDIPQVVRRGTRLFNRGRYLDVQVLWEEAWRTAPTDDRPFLEALVQLAGGLHLRTRRGGVRGAPPLMPQARRGGRDVAGAGDARGLPARGARAGCRRAAEGVRRLRGVGALARPPASLCRRATHPTAAGVTGWT